MELTPFDFVKSINKHTEIPFDVESEKAYAPFIVNRAFSYFPDTILAANELNTNGNLPKQLQYHYLLNIIRPSNRFAKWSKKVDSDSFNVVQEHFKFNTKKTLAALRILSKDDIEKLRSFSNKGG